MSNILEELDQRDREDAEQRQFALEFYPAAEVDKDHSIYPETVDKPIGFGWVALAVILVMLLSNGIIALVIAIF